MWSEKSWLYLIKANNETNKIKVYIQTRPNGWICKFDFNERHTEKAIYVKTVRQYKNILFICIFLSDSVKGNVNL